MTRYECLIVVGGHLTQMAERQLHLLLELHAKESITTGVLTLWKAERSVGWIAASQNRRYLDDSSLTWLHPRGGHYAAKLALVLSPGLAHVDPSRLPRVDADHVVIWPIEPPRRGQLPLAEQAPLLAEAVGERLGGQPLWAARTASEWHYLAHKAAGLELTSAVWWPLLREPEEHRGSSSLHRPRRVGRHWWDGRPLGPMEQSEIAETLGDVWPMVLSFHGETSVLQSLPPVHPRQDVQFLEAKRVSKDDVLDDLALFLAVGGSEEPLGVPVEIFEALEADVVIIGPPSLSSAIDAALPTADLPELSGLAAQLMSDERVYEAVRTLQHQIYHERHAPRSYRERIADYVGHEGGAISPAAPTPIARRAERVLFVSDDSMHLEHLTRELAIAACLPDAFLPFFVTTARNAWLAEERGYPVEFATPHNSRTYRQTRDSAGGWNFWFERQLAELIAFVDPRAVVFDGVYPFSGLIGNSQRYSDLPFIWIRQPLWRPSAALDALSLSERLDLVIEPGDLAADFDRGATPVMAERVLQTAPIVAHAPRQRNEARKAIGLSEGTLAILLDGRLPSNVLKRRSVERLLDELIDGGASFWMMDDRRSGSSADLDYPVQKIEDPALEHCCSAFDGAISAADYRSVHDLAAARVPTVFIAGLGSRNDDQAVRAAHAERQGWAKILVPADVYGARDAARCLLDPDQRGLMVSALDKIPALDGAEEAALAIAEAIHGLPLGNQPGDGIENRACETA